MKIDAVSATPASRGSLPYAALVLTCIVWGTTWIGTKIGIRGVHPIFYSALRQTLGGLCFLTYFTITGKAVWPTLKQWGYLLMMAVLLFVMSNAFTVWCLQYISSGLGAVLGAVFPLWVAIIDWILGDKDKPGLLSFTGLLLGVAGVAIIFYEHLGDFHNSNFVIGIVLALIATLTWAIGTVIMSRRTVSLNRYYSLGWQMLLAGVMLNLVSVGSGVAKPLEAIPAFTWWSIVYMVIFGSILAFVAYLYTLQHLPTTLASVYAYINPIVAVVLGHFILNESWSMYLAVGALVTLAGVYLVNSGYRKQE